MSKGLTPVALAVFLLIIFVTIFIGSAKPPTQELAQAEKAIVLFLGVEQRWNAPK